ncbi:hypothetical protein B0I12_002558 [Microbacterium hydrothermale]|uniref:hypothetical protein n=1 Tax=Microbacterium hydrothermale TaxID=857427 RepID=UPI0022273E13|nr:hypothetical protein [Microbacterium hydrothermale]MCW2165403.1 hypothetical protein [Microbacterium hydrothermale]
MADAPEMILNRAIATFLDAHGLAVYRPTGAIVEKGIRLDGVMPTTVKEFTLLTPLRPVPDGRANMTYRTQVFTRRKGSVATVRDWSAELRTLLDQKPRTPNVLGISWAEEGSATDFAPNSEGYADTVATYVFRGRRVI